MVHLTICEYALGEPLVTISRKRKSGGKLFCFCELDIILSLAVNQTPTF
jgi:hypothetical protein